MIKILTKIVLLWYFDTFLRTFFIDLVIFFFGKFSRIAIRMLIWLPFILIIWSFLWFLWAIDVMKITLIAISFVLLRSVIIVSVIILVVFGFIIEIITIIIIWIIVIVYSLTLLLILRTHVCTEKFRY